MKAFFWWSMVLVCVAQAVSAQRSRDLGISIGVLKPGKYNAITDVNGVKVGQVTLVNGADVRTGVTAVLPGNGNFFQSKFPAAIFVANGFGKLAGSTQVDELGLLETPVILTNTLSVPEGIAGAVEWTLLQKGNEKVRSVNALVGETNDGGLNNIRARNVQMKDVIRAIEEASDGIVQEGNVGAGTGTQCFAWKGGIGTASRKLPAGLGGYTVGVLVQTNFGGVLQIDGVPVGEELGKYAFKETLDKSADGSCMIVVATDAPMDARNLKRLAKRAFLGLGKTGGIASNGSGDYVIAFSTQNRVSHAVNTPTESYNYLHNDYTSPVFMAAIEATEEAIINSLFAAETVTGNDGNKSEKIPVQKVMEIMKKFGRIKP